MKKGILFDLDGTLWDSSRQVLEAWNGAIVEAGRTEQFSLADMRGFMGHTLEDIARMMFPDLARSEQLRLINLCTRAEHAYLLGHPAPLYPDEEPTLRALAKEYELGIVSNCQEGYIEIFLKQCGFADVFSDFECAGRTKTGKGENIALLAARRGMERCVYVGDTASDMEAAREAGVPFVHAAYGFGQVSRCAARLESLAQLLEIAARLL